MQQTKQYETIHLSNIPNIWRKKLLKIIGMSKYPYLKKKQRNPFFFLNKFVLAWACVPPLLPGRISHLLDEIHKLFSR